MLKSALKGVPCFPVGEQLSSHGRGVPPQVQAGGGTSAARGDALAAAARARARAAGGARSAGPVHGAQERAR